MCTMSTPIIGQPISGLLFGFLGYTSIFDDIFTTTELKLN